MILEKCGLGCGGFESENFVGAGEGDTALLGTLEITFEDQVRFVNLLKRPGFLTDGGGEGVETCGAAFALSREGLEEAFVHFVQAVLIDFEHLQGGDRGCGGGGALGSGQGVVTNPAEKIVGDAGGAPAATGDFGGRILLQFDFEERGGAPKDRGQILDRVVVETVGDAEAGSEWGTQQTRAGRGADEGEAREVQADGAGGGALVDHDIDAKILNGGVEVLLDDFGEAVNFVDKEDIPLLEAGEESGKVAGFFDGGTRGGADGGVHFRAEDVGERGFSQPGRTAEKEMVERLLAGSGRIEKDAETVLKLGLAGEVGETGGTEGLVDGVPRGAVQFFDGLGGHGGRMAEGGKFESGKVTRYAR